MLDKLMKLLTAKERENYVEKTPKDIYRGISQKTGLSKEDVAKIGGVESQHGKYTKNMTGGSASGTMQIMPRLAKALRPGSEKVLNDSNTQEQIASDFLNLNTPTIKEIASSSNREPSIIDQYAMYNLGMGRGKKFLKAKDTDLVSDILPANVIEKNAKFYKGKTVGEARKAMQQMLDERGPQAEFYPNEKDFADLFKEEE